MNKKTNISNLNECNCSYCKNFTFLWDLNPCSDCKPKTLWVEIPKNASSSWKNFHKRRKNILNKKSLLEYEAGIVIVRDPVERFRSLLSHYFLDGKRKKNGIKWLNEIININYNNINIQKNIANIVLDNFSKLNFIAEPHHFFLQSDFIPDAFWKLKKQVIIDTENISQDYVNISHANISSSKNIYLSQINIEKINEIYKQDFILYKKL